MYLFHFFLTTLEILKKAMNEGYVSLNNIKMVICGPPAVGKTAFKDLLLGKSAPLEHNSTGIARPIQAIQITANPEDKDGEYMWKEASKDDLLRMLSEAIEKVGTTPSHEEESSTTSDTPSPAHGAASSQEDTTSIQPLPEDTTAPEVSLPTAQASNDTPHQPTTKATTPPTTSEATTTPPSASEATTTPLTTSEATTTPPSASEATTDSEVDELLQNLCRRIRDVKGSQSQKLLEATWIHLLDSGGQPQFTDLLPMFVRDNSLYIIVMNLEATKSLGDKPKIVYSINGEKVSAQKEMTMTTLQIIENSVRSIVAAPRDKEAAETSSSTDDESKPMFVILATHIDKLQSEDLLEARLKEYNEKIQKQLHKFHNHFIFYKPNELIFPVNNLCDKNRHQEAAEIRNRLMPQFDEKPKRKKKIPIRWYIFYILMKRKASKEKKHGMISFKDCKDIGEGCDMAKEEVKKCLEYLDLMRLCIFYPDANVVFTDPQFLIECLSKIVQVSFVDYRKLQKILPKGFSLSKKAADSLKKDGIFDESLLDNLELTFIPGLFSKSNLLNLLQHFNVISLIEADGANDDRQYFMPILLPPERLTEEQKARLKEKHNPLQITFKDIVFSKVSFIFSLSIYFSFYNAGFISNDGSVSIKPQSEASFLY